MDKNSKDKKNNDEKKRLGKLMEVGGIMVEIEDSKEGVPPSATELEKQLREGGIEVIEGKNSPEDDEQIS
ncbi:MAG: hypothetical protein HZB09_02750 [Candidatus Yonathbacteria bacterium]|nr:hypothetical protein [Candidatus Yonathbacteria bacterium]